MRYANRIRVPAFLLAGELEKPQLSFSVDMEKALVNAPSVTRSMINRNAVLAEESFKKSTTAKGMVA